MTPDQAIALLGNAFVILCTTFLAVLTLGIIYLSIYMLKEHFQTYFKKKTKQDHQ